MTVESPGLHGPKQIEDAAIAFGMQIERAEGREPVDTRADKAAVADLVSGDRVIEVKAAGATSRGFELWPEPNQYREAGTNPDHFQLYLVENVRQGDPAKFRLLRIGGEQLAQVLPKAKHQEYRILPVPVAVYDQLMNEASSLRSPTALRADD